MPEKRKYLRRSEQTNSSNEYMEIQAIIEYTLVEQITFITNYREDVKATTFVNCVKLTETTMIFTRKTRTRKKKDYLHLFILFYVEP